MRCSAIRVLGRDALLAVAGLVALSCGPRAHAPRGTAARAAPREFDDCAGAKWCPRMVVIPAGRFPMGAPATERGRDTIEGPVHQVTVPAFAAAKFDVTRGEWAAFARATARPTRRGCAWTGRAGGRPDPAASWDSLGFPQDDRHPVVCVTWEDARDYARWLGARTGRPYRLLTEAEWEYAARARTTTAYPWGDTASRSYANYGADNCCGPLAEGRDRWLGTSPVGAFPPNAFGLHDMHGNVLQWVQDCFAAGYAGLPTNGVAYVSDTRLTLSGPLAALNGRRSCEYRVLRGGDWGDAGAFIRSAARNFGPPPGAPADYASGGIGFRVARSLP